MKLYHDSNKTTAVQWYFCDNAKPLPFYTRFASHNWDSTRDEWHGLGEVYGTKHKWVNGAKPVGASAEIVGSADQFLHGCSIADLIRLDCPQGELELVGSDRVVVKYRPHVGAGQLVLTGLSHVPINHAYDDTAQLDIYGTGRDQRNFRGTGELLLTGSSLENRKLRSDYGQLNISGSDSVTIVRDGWTIGVTNGASYIYTVHDDIRFNAENSLDCGGTNDLTQTGFAEKTFSFDADTTLIFKISGKTERQNAGYDTLTILVDAGVEFFRQSEEENLECAMQNHGDYLELRLGAGDHTVRLEFSTVDGQFHLDCFWGVKITRDDGGMLEITADDTETATSPDRDIGTLEIFGESAESVGMTDYGTLEIDGESSEIFGAGFRDSGTGQLEVYGGDDI